MTPTHPNANFANFVKAIVRRIASACGVSYNRLSHDYESVNYSSLREASLDEAKTYANLQRFLIDNWKNIQYEIFLRSYIINFP
jgi:capsid protein